MISSELLLKRLFGRLAFKKHFVSGYNNPFRLPYADATILVAAAVDSGESLFLGTLLSFALPYTVTQKLSFLKILAVLFCKFLHFAMNFNNSWPSASKFKYFSRSLEPNTVDCCIFDQNIFFSQQVRTILVKKIKIHTMNNFSVIKHSKVQVQHLLILFSIDNYIANISFEFWQITNQVYQFRQSFF